MSILPIQYTVKRLTKDELDKVGVGVGASIGTPTIVPPMQTEPASGEIGVVTPPVVPVVSLPPALTATAPFEDGTTPADNQKPGTTGYQYQPGETLPDGTVYGSPKPSMMPLVVLAALALWVVYG